MAAKKGRARTRPKHRKAGNSVQARTGQAGVKAKPPHTRPTGERHPLPPKLTPPRPARLYPRERLFDLLDRTREDHRVIWMSAPGGAGKTSLAASYLSARKLPTLWYQVDQGDGDVASFFYYIGLAAQRAAPRHKKPLPHLTPEYLADVPTFARNFFRELYRRLPRNSAIVLDNYQDAPEDSLLHDVLQTAISEMPEGMNLLVLSRVEPPAVLARLRLCDHAACLDWEKIQLTREETAGFASLRAGQNRLDPATIETLHQRTQGWAAGVVLMLEQARSGETLELAHVPSGQKLLFDYFAGEIFAKLDEATQHVLLTSGLLPKMTTAMVAQLTAVPDAGRVLEELHRKNYFTLKHTHSETVYEYHPLFREFLLTRAKQTFAAEHFNQAQRQAAALLEADGQIEAAAALWQEASDWTGLAQLGVTHAQSLVAQGRGRTLEGWLRSLPPELLARMPWLLYWLGICRMPYNPSEARTHFENAFAQFDRAAEVAGLCLSWSGVVDTYIYEWRDVRPMERWIDVLHDLLIRYPAILSGDIGTRVVIGMFCALSHCRPAHPDLPAWEARARDIAFNSPDITTRVTVGHHLLLYYSWWIGDQGKALQLVDMLRQSVEHKKATPLALIWWYAIEATYQWKMPASQEACLAAVKKGLEIAESSGIHMFDTLLYAQGTWGALTFGDLELGREFLRKTQATLNPMRHADICQYHMQAYLEASLCGEHALAAEHAKTAFLAAQATGAPYAIAVTHVIMGLALHAQGSREDGFKHLAKACEIAEEMRSDIVKFSVYRAYAEIELIDHAAGADPHTLRRLMAVGAKHGYLNQTFWNSVTMSRLCAAALEHRIEPDYVRTLIRKRKLVPPNETTESWPWPIKIYTLGRFRVVLDDRPLRFQGKAQRRPLELLMALLSFGGRDVSASRLAEALWPDAEADAAQIAFKAALQRLRKLLGDDEALVLTNNQLSLDSRRVWVDAWAFERGLSRLKPGERAGTENEQAALRAFALYQGPYLHDTDAAGWSLAARERLRAKFIGGLTTTSARWMEQRRHEETLGLLERGLAADPLAEELYRRQMRCHAALGRRAEAMAVYDRCQRVLAAQLRIAPAAETQALYAALRDNRPLPP